MWVSSYCDCSSEVCVSPKLRNHARCTARERKNSARTRTHPCTTRNDVQGVDVDKNDINTGMFCCRSGDHRIRYSSAKPRDSATFSSIEGVALLQSHGFQALHQSLVSFPTFEYKHNCSVFCSSTGPRLLMHGLVNRSFLRIAAHAACWHHIGKPFQINFMWAEISATCS